ncbi:MAG: YdcF family protein [Lachnospiraceae bacterium]|nr:YdcF family protein [Lachnospiraceae bacterium]
MKRIILSIVGFLGFGWFAIPFFMRRILNIGNGTGMFLFGVLAVYGIWMERINRWIGRGWRSRGGKVLISVCCVLVFVAAVLTVIFSGFMAKAARVKPEKDGVLIVLGCKVYGENASLMLRERMDAAYDYMMVHENVNCILSGGQGPEEDITEAACMYRYMVDKGVDPARLYREDASTSTRENLEFSQHIMEEHDWGDKVILVTNEFHEYRAAQIGKKLGLQVSAVPAKTAWWLFSTYYVRELYGILYEYIL